MIVGRERQRRLPGAGALALALLAGACGRVETKQPVPWLKTRTVHSPSIGGFSGGSSGATPYVRTFGLFWRKLDGCLGGEALDADTVAVFCSDTFHSGTALIRRGETTPKPACGAYSSYSLVLPDRSGVDCSTVIEGRAPIVPTRVRYWRVGPTREVRFDTTLTVAQPGRALDGPSPRFYDERMQGYFLSAAEDFQAAPACVLLTVEANALVVVASGPELSRADCSDSATWSRKSGRTLRPSVG